MAPLRLRTRAAIAAGLFGVFAVGATLAYQVRKSADADLAESMALDVAILSSLPPLQDALRRADRQAFRYLLTGNPTWLEARTEAEDRALKELQELSDVSPKSGPDAEAVQAIREAAEAALAEQRDFAARFAAGKMSHAQALALATSGRTTDAAVRRIAALRMLSYDGILARVEEARRASRGVMAVILATGLSSLGLMLVVLTVFVVRPVEALDAWARSWSPERPMQAPPISAAPELEGLGRSLSEMARRAAEQVRQEAEVAKLRGQLVSTLSHEFNNSLSVVQGMAHLLEETEGTGSAEDRARYYLTLKANLRSISAEMETLIEMGRNEGGRFQVSPRRCDLAAVFRESAERLRIMADRRRLGLEVVSPAVPPLVRADPEALALVATNLISNAIKYTPDGGRVAVEVAPTPDGARVTVSDTGIGIAPEDHERVLGGNYRTEAGRARAKGFGVGLALARSIVEAHGARLELDSAPGRGSRFSLELPRWREG